MSRILLEKGDGLSAIAEGLDVPPWLSLVEVLTDDGAPSKGAVAPELVLTPYAVAYLERLATKIDADASDGRFVRYELFAVGPPVSDAAPSGPALRASAVAPSPPGKEPPGEDEGLARFLVLWTLLLWLAEKCG